MILVEADDDLATYVSRFFSRRYEVTRFGSLSGLARATATEPADVLFAEVSPQVPDQVALVEQLHSDHPKMKIVLAYLEPPPGPTWERRIRKSADILIRKPYGVADVGEAILALETGDDS